MKEKVDTDVGFQQSAFSCQHAVRRAERENAKRPRLYCMATMPQDQEFLDYLVRALVDTPSAVKTERKVDEMGVLITLKVDPADMGKIIGRNGATAKAIRSLLRVVGIKNNARVNLKIEEPEGGRGPRMMRDETDDRGAPRMRDVDDVVDDLKL